jgi:hypothetical protein
VLLVGGEAPCVFWASDQVNGGFSIFLFNSWFFFCSRDNLEIIYYLILLLGASVFIRRLIIDIGCFLAVLNRVMPTSTHFLNRDILNVASCRNDLRTLASYQALDNANQHSHAIFFAEVHAKNQVTNDCLVHLVRNHLRLGGCAHVYLEFASDLEIKAEMPEQGWPQFPLYQPLCLPERVRCQGWDSQEGRLGFFKVLYGYDVSFILRGFQREYQRLGEEKFLTLITNLLINRKTFSQFETKIRHEFKPIQAEPLFTSNVRSMLENIGNKTDHEDYAAYFRRVFKHWKGLIGPLLKGRSFLEQKEAIMPEIYAQRERYDEMRNVQFSQTLFQAVRDAKHESCKIFVVAGAAHLFGRAKGLGDTYFAITNAPLRAARENDLSYDVIGLPPKV